MSLRFFSQHKPHAVVPRNPNTGLVSDFAYWHLLDKGLPNIQVELNNKEFASTIITLSDLTTQNAVLIMHPGFLTPRIALEMPSGWSERPGVAGCQLQAQQFNHWAETFKYFGYQTYFLSHMPSEILYQAAQVLNLPHVNFLSDPEFLLQDAWRLPVGVIEGQQYYERVVTVLPQQTGVQRVFSGIVNPSETAELVLQYVVDERELQTNILRCK